MKKKILIVSNYFYPQNSPRAFRTTELVKEFAKNGHDVTLLISKNEEIHVPFELKHNVKIKSFGKKRFEDIDIQASRFQFIKRIWRRMLLIIFEFPDIQLSFLIKKALKSERKYDVLISVASPHTVHWGVALAWKKKNEIAKLWIADCGDPYMGTTTDSFKKLFYFKFIEKYWCNKVDHITVPFPGAVDGYYKEFRDKISIIPQGFKFNEIKIDKDKYKPNEITTFAYAGLLIPGSRDPRPLIDFLIESNAEFKFILYTRSQGMISSYIDRYRDKIEIRDYIPRKELLIELSKMDFLINFDNSVATQLPSKLIDYYITKRPVLSINSFNFEDEIIKQFLDKDYRNKFHYENTDQYQIENVAQQFLNFTK